MSNTNKNKVNEKRESERPCTVEIDTSPSVSFINLEKPTYGKDGGTGEGGVLVTQERMTDADTANVDANAKADAPDASNAPKINTPKINVKRGIVKLCAVSITLY